MYYVLFIFNYSLKADALSGNTNIGPTHFDDFHNYTVDWKSGPDGVRFLFQLLLLLLYTITTFILQKRK
jgi:hypothetical protein